MFKNIIIFFKGFPSYFGTLEFNQGLYIEITSILLQILLFTIFIKVILWIWNYKENQARNKIIHFYTIQFIREVVFILLEILNYKKNIMKLLMEELAKNKLESLYANPFYGNTENLFQFLNIKFNENSFKINTKQELKNVAIKINSLIELTDKYVILSSSVNNNYNNKFFEIRLLMVILKDDVDKMTVKKISNKEINDILKNHLKIFYELFKEEKKYFDKIIRIGHKIHVFTLIALIPFVMIYRFFAPFLAKNKYLI